MRGAVYRRYGPPEVVRIEELETPTPGEGELLVRVNATTVNRTDCGFRAGHPWIVRLFSGLTRPKFPVLGTEFAGIVEAVGSAVKSFRVGDGVFGFSEDDWGAHAEYLTIREDGPVATIPGDLAFEEVTPSTEGSFYAMTIIRGVGIRPGHDVLVNGATGAIGSAAVQLLKHTGARVTAVCATEHTDLVRGLGADSVVDYTKEDFTKDAYAYDAVIDAVGKSSFGRCRRILKPHGAYASTELGPWSMNPLLALVTPALPGRNVRFPIPRKLGRDGVLRLRGLLESGAFRPVIDRRYPLERIVDAYRYVERGQKVGSVVIDVAPPTEAEAGGR